MRKHEEACEHSIPTTLLSLESTNFYYMGLSDSTSDASIRTGHKIISFSIAAIGIYTPFYH